MVLRKVTTDITRALSMLNSILACYFIAIILMGILIVDEASALEGRNDVSIRLDETSEPPEEIHIGQAIDRSFTVSSLKGECYVRLNMKIDDADGASIFEYDDPIEEGWIRKEDGWWYLKQPLANGDSAGFTSEMMVKDDIPLLPRASTSLHLSVTTTAEAVDARAIVPDWESDDPWKNIVPDDVFTDVSSGDIGGDGRVPGVSRSIRSLSSLARTFDDSDLVLLSLASIGCFAALFGMLAYRYTRQRPKEMTIPKGVCVSRDHAAAMEVSDERKE